MSNVPRSAADASASGTAESSAASYEAGGTAENTLPPDPSWVPTLVQTEVPASFAPPKDGLIGRTIGSYLIVQQIGRGGMGTVYRAVRADGEFQIEVAIKFVSRGMDSGLISERFRKERQILAKLEHPNIARLLDGGTTDNGLAYFVMEYVHGEPLTKYCDSHQLSVAERLRLFRRVCDAVSYAHENLVVHRDLKPDNILVTKDGVPKLLDFGIAKLLDPSDREDSDLGAMTMVRVGTPAYSSPEQIRGESVGIGSDVYSLGIILYELLTGMRPYRVESLNWEESARVICERDATRPSSVISSAPRAGASSENVEISRARNTTVEALRKRLIGDLDNILMVALRKDPGRRYRSVYLFSEELQRHLDGRPVMARGDSVVYRTGKFLGRHKFGLAATALFTTLLLCAGIYSAWSAHRLANRVAEDRKLASSFLVEIHDELAKLPGSTPAREALLTKSVDYLNGLARETGNNGELQQSLALSYERFAELQVGVGGAGLGNSARALTIYDKARTLREAIVRESPGDPWVRYELASNYLLGSYITGRISSLDQRLAYDRKALAISESLTKLDPGSKDYQALLARAYTSAAYSLGMLGRSSEAIDYYRQAVPIRERLAKDAPKDLEARRELANVHYRVGVIDAQSEKPGEALVGLKQALRLQEEILSSNQEDERVRSDIAATHHFIGISMGAEGDFSSALPHFRKAIALRESALGADERDARTRSLLAGNYAEQSTALLRSGRKQEALSSVRRAIELQQELLAVDARGVPTRFSLADYYARLAGICAELGFRLDAAQSWKKAAQFYDELEAEGHLRLPSDLSQAAHARSEAHRFAIGG